MGLLDELTDRDLRDLSALVGDYIKSSSIPVEDLPQAESLAGLRSLPAVELRDGVRRTVSVPLRLLGQPALDTDRIVADALSRAGGPFPSGLAVLNVNALCGDTARTLEAALAALSAREAELGVPFRKPGAVLVYRDVSSGWRAVQYTGADMAGWSDTAHWTDFAGRAPYKEVYPEDFGAVADGITDCTAALQAAIDTAYRLKRPVVLSEGEYLITRAVYVCDGIQMRGQGIYNTVIRTPFRTKAKNFRQGTEEYQKAVVAESYVARDRRAYNTATDPGGCPALDPVNGHNRFYLGDGCVGYYDGDRDTNPAHPLYYPKPSDTGTKRKKWDEWQAERKKIQDTGRWVGLTGRENYAKGAIKSTQYPGLAHTADSKSSDYIPERANSVMHTGIRHVTLRDFQIMTNSSDRGMDSAVNFKYQASLIPKSRREELDSSCLGIILENLYLYSCGGNGFEVTRVVQCSIKNVTARQCAGYGFLIEGVTSTTFYGCYANGCIEAGYRLKGVNYSSLVACAADSCSTAYNLSGCDGVTLASCGAERCKLVVTEDNVTGGAELAYKGRSYVIRDCKGVTLTSCYAFTLSTKALLDIEEVAPEDVAALMSGNRHLYVSSSQNVMVMEPVFKSLRRIRTAPFKDAAGDKCSAEGGAYDPDLPGSRYWQMQDFLAGAIFEVTGEGNSVSVYSDLSREQMAALSEIRDGNLDLYDPGTVPHPDGHDTARKTLKGTDGNGGWTYTDSGGAKQNVIPHLLEVAYPVSPSSTRYWKWRASLELLRVEDYKSGSTVVQRGFRSVLGKDPVDWASVTVAQMAEFRLDVVADRERTSFIDGDRKQFGAGVLFDAGGQAVPVVSGVAAEKRLYDWGIRTFLNSETDADRSGRTAAFTMFGNNPRPKEDGTGKKQDAVLELVTRVKNSELTTMPFAVKDSAGMVLFGLEPGTSDRLLCRGSGDDRKSYLSKGSSARVSGGFLPEGYGEHHVRAVLNAVVECLQQHGLMEGGFILDTVPRVILAADGVAELAVPYRYRTWEDGKTVEVKEWGFVYSATNRVPTIESSSQRKVGSATLTAGKGELYGNITGLSARTYYIRPYLKSNGATVYGPAVECAVKVAGPAV